MDRFLAFDASTPSLDVFEDDTTVPRRKKRRSSAGRRVSFAEMQTVHVFQRDDEYNTPPLDPEATPPQVWGSDMSFTEQRRRRPLTPITPNVSPPASVDKCLTMQCTDVVDPLLVAKRLRRRRVFSASPSPEKAEPALPKEPEAEAEAFVSCCSIIDEVSNRCAELEAQIARIIPVGKERTKEPVFPESVMGWRIRKVSVRVDEQKLETTFDYRVAQSITVDRKLGQGWIQLSTRRAFIEKGFPETNAVNLFEGLLPAEKLKVAPLSSLPAFLERTSKLVGNLVDVAREISECRVDYRSLKSAVFMNDPVSGVSLRLSFEHYGMRLKISLLFRLQQLSSGEYPEDIVPFNIDVEFSKRTQNVITDQDVMKAVSSLQPAHGRFHKICACVSSFMP